MTPISLSSPRARASAMKRIAAMGSPASPKERNPLENVTVRARSQMP